MTHRIRRRLVAGLGAALLLAGCSGAEEQVAPEGGDVAPATTDSAPQDTASDATGTTAATPTTKETAPQDASGDNGRQTSAPPGDVAADTQDVDSAPLTSADGAFSFQTPQGWSDATAEAGADAVAAARADDRAGGFFTNLVVVTEEPIDDLSTSIQQAAATIAGADGAYTMAAKSEIDAEPAYGFSLRRTVQDTDIVQVQRWVEHEEVLYILTLSSARDQRRVAADTLEEIVRSWSWQ